jgi:hypothetical protein
VATLHYSRSIEDGDPWLPVRQPWIWALEQAAACRHTLPVPINNEPIGPQTSVEQDDGPARLAMAYVTTFLAGNAAYTLHTGAGVRGGGSADRAIGRSANFSETPNLEAALAAMAHARAYLPADLANWRRHDARDAGYPIAGAEDAARRGSLAASYAATNGDRFVAVVIGLERKVDFSAKKACQVEVHGPSAGEPLARHDLAPGEPLSLSGAHAFVLTGRCR